MTDYKYPRTPHLPWSLGRSDDDVSLEKSDIFKGRPIVISTKYDGENTTLTRDSIHARSILTPSHSSRDWVRALWGKIRYSIPEDMRVCGENVYATHSIHYTSLKSYFLVFSIWEDDMCLSWDETLEYCDLLGLTTVRVLYRGSYDNFENADVFTALARPDEFNPVGQEHEGYVMRYEGPFRHEEFGQNVAKYVRADHVTTDEHWLSRPLVPNELSYAALHLECNRLH
jgi:hypothetical protein